MRYIVQLVRAIDSKLVYNNWLGHGPIFEDKEKAIEYCKSLESREDIVKLRVMNDSKEVYKWEVK